VKLHDSFSQVIANHNYPPIISELLGQFLAASVLLGTTIKFAGRVTLQVKTEGPVSLIMAECTSNRQVRGIVKIDLEKLDRDTKTDAASGLSAGVFRNLLGAGTLGSGTFDSATIGAGTMAITIDPDKGKRYQGIVALEGDSLAQCMEKYFLQSEQLPTTFVFAVNGTTVAGLMLQQLPAQLQKDSAQRRNFWEDLSCLCATLSPGELLQLGARELLYRLFHQHPVRLFDASAVVYQCSCSRERTAKALTALGQKEINGILTEQAEVSMNCDFCGAQYKFDQADVDLLFLEGQSGKLH